MGISWLVPRVDSMGDFVFFRLILSYLREEIQKFGIELMGRAMSWVGMIALTLLTLWILVQGFRIVTGQSRDSMMALVMNSLKATLILSVATSMAMFGTNLDKLVTEDVKKEINQVVTGSDSSPEDAIDRNLAWMQVALSSVDVLDVAGDPSLDAEKTRALYMVGFGTGGPAIVGGTMLLLNEVAIALFIGLGPLFILCLLFDQTKPLFGRWLYYGIGTMFSMAVLSAMVSIALEMVVRVASSFWGAALIGGLVGANFNDGMTSQAMQQGGLGLILTTLIVTAPPMAANFFQGTLGQFSPYNVFGSAARPQPGYPPGTGPAQNVSYSSSPAQATRSDAGFIHPTAGQRPLFEDVPKSPATTRRAAGGP
ncbi:type IV secretion system protein [Cognatilysobacter lacus]|uniref:Type IV secretion system protein n=1 Tax=Cognatilysobacter lacus TaxID=1643323 RepID=A0A5D8ZBQ0_9GAMM|nr:type IV secretion system protein [Lysobacter lacus]TZF91483.1 type IV secretion system protein [Lysobacter lacus]